MNAKGCRSTVARSRHPAWLLCLVVWALGVPIGASPLPNQGTLDIRIPRAVLYDPPTTPWGRSPEDLWVRIPIRDGRLAESGLAWTPRTPALDHSATIRNANVADGRVQMDIGVEFLNQPPEVAGGRGSYHVDLVQQGVAMQGDFTGDLTELDPAEAEKAWRAIGGKGKPAFAARLVAGKVKSLTHLARAGVAWGVGQQVPIVATGTTTALPVGAAAPAHPRILVSLAEQAAFTAAIQAVSGERSPSAALLQAMKDRAPASDMAKAWAAAWAPGAMGPAARFQRLAAAAVVYDACASGWPEAQANAAAEALLVESETLCGLRESIAGEMPIFAPGGALARLDGRSDYRLGMCRAAVAMAVLAVDPSPATLGRHDRLRAVAAWSLERSANSAIGDHGAGTGANGYAEYLSLALPALTAWQRTLGQNLASETGLPQLGRWLATTGGMDLSGPASLSATVQAIAAPTQSATGGAARPLVIHDRRMGTLAGRSGWDDKAFISLFEGGSGDAGAKALRGAMSVRGLGREWIARPQTPAGTFGWTPTSRQNVLQVRQAEVSGRSEAEQEHGGRIVNVRAARDGSFSIAMVSHGYREETPGDDDTEGALAWRTLGVDYSGKSGAPFLGLVVEGAVGLQDRQQIWEIAIGQVPAAQVTIDGPTFIVRPTPGGPSLKGTFVYPTTAWVDYVPPRGDEGGRIRVFRQKPGEKSLDRLWKDIDDRLGAQIQAMLDNQDADVDPRKFDLPLDEVNVAKQELMLRQNETIYLKLLKETSSVKMGAPDRRPRAKANLVGVLTIQEKDAPAVKVLDTRSSAWLQVGGQTLTYREHLVLMGEQAPNPANP